MGINLTNKAIQDTYEGLVQISGSQLTDGTGSLIPSLDVSASFATTASYALNVPTFDTGSLITTASVSDATITFTKGDASTFPIEVNNVSSSISASYATTASFALNVSTPSLQEVTDVDNVSTNSIQVNNAGRTATYAGDKISNNSLGFTIEGGTTTNGVLTLKGNDTGDVQVVLNGPTDSVIITGDINATGYDITASGIEATTINVGTISGSQAYFTSASITDLTTITGSIVQIGDAFVLLNTATPTSRYAGILVEDSGSTPVNYTASFFFDSQTNDWNYEYFDGAQTDFGVAIFGPEYNTKGAPVYLTANTLPKAVGSHHLEDSSISDDGTDVVVNANISASGFVSASTYYGDGSNLSGVDAFPYTGSAEITGSLRVIDELIVGASNNTIIKQVGDENIVIVGGGTNDINHTGVNAFGDGMAIVGGFNNTITGGFINETSIFGGRNHTITSAQYSTIVGGSGNSITGEYNHIIVGGSSNSITAQTANGIFAGTSNTANGYGAVVLGGNNNDANLTLSAILGGQNHVAGHSYSVILGGQGLTTTKADEAVVKHLSIYGDTFISSSLLGTGSLIDNLGQEGVATTEAIEHMVYCTQAEYDALTPDANTMYVIKGSGDVVNDLLVEGRLTGAIDVLTDVAGTTTLDCSLGNYFTLAMPAGGTTALTPTNITTGQTINIKITQNATASTLTYASSIKFPGGTPFTISTGSGNVDVLTLVSFDGTTLQATGLANFS